MSTQPAQSFLTFFDDDVIGFESSDTGVPATLHPEEAALVERALSKRRNEFAAGRSCAHRALAESLDPDGRSDRVAGAQPLLADAHRSPIWPASIVGSITHARGYAAAVVAPADVYAGIGIDAEERGRVRADLERRICTEAERDWLAGIALESRRDWLTVLFSAKEAIYKCLYPASRSPLGFADATLAFSETRFEAVLHRPLSNLEGFEEPGASLSGGFAMGESLVFAGAALRHRADDR